MQVPVLATRSPAIPHVAPGATSEVHGRRTGKCSGWPASQESSASAWGLEAAAPRSADAAFSGGPETDDTAFHDTECIPIEILPSCNRSVKVGREQLQAKTEDALLDGHCDNAEAPEIAVRANE